MDRVKTAVILAATLALIPCAFADETTFCTRYIRSLPFTITTQAHYCFDRNLATAITSGAAITINADFVLLDLNNFRLSGSAAGTATLAVGIHANNRSNLTIRNGNIRGFAYGILVEGDGTTSSRNVTVEKNVLDGNTVAGITVFGTSYSIRDNQVYNTGGTTSTAAYNCGPQPPTMLGISTLGQRNTLGCEAGGYGEVVGNTVVNTFPDGLSGGGLTISIAGLNGIVANNRVINQKPSIAYPAIVGTVCRDNTVLEIAGPGYSCEHFVGINSDH
jgi:parallel beta-helix repeat protein